MQTGHCLVELSLAVHCLGAGPVFLLCFLSGQLDCPLVTGLLVILVFGWIIDCFFYYLMGGVLFGNIYPTTNVRGHVRLAKLK